jgi:hypothetical protein
VELDELADEATHLQLGLDFHLETSGRSFFQPVFHDKQDFWLCLIFVSQAGGLGAIGRL